MGLFNSNIFNNEIFNTEGTMFPVVPAASASRYERGGKTIWRKNLFPAPFVSAKVQARIRSLKKKLAGNVAELDIDAIVVELNALSERMRVSIELSRSAIVPVQDQREYVAMISSPGERKVGIRSLTYLATSERDKELAIIRAEKVIREAQELAEEARRQEEEFVAAAIFTLASMIE